MVQCLQRYDWVKLLRSHLPEGKGVMGAWAKLASRAAFRKGNAYYCGFSNPVEPGMWAGGVVGLKSILGAKKRHQALQTMERLQELGLISYELDPATKKLTYQILDWVVKCSGAECMDGAVYTTDGYGFLCLPRNITQRLAAINYQFEEADAWLDLWCHTVSNDRRNVFSFMAPAVQYGKHCQRDQSHSCDNNTDRRCHGNQKQDRISHNDKKEHRFNCISRLQHAAEDLAGVGIVRRDGVNITVFSVFHSKHLPYGCVGVELSSISKSTFLGLLRDSPAS